MGDCRGSLYHAGNVGPVRQSVAPPEHTTDREPLFVGVDAGIKHDNAARVAVKWDEAGEKLILVSHRIWKPTPSQPLDLENTVEAGPAKPKRSRRRGGNTRRSLPDAPIHHHATGGRLADPRVCPDSSQLHAYGSDPLRSTQPARI